MDEQNREALDEQIARVFEKMNTLEPGTPEYTRAREDLSALQKTAQEEMAKAREFMAQSDKYTLEVEDRKAKAKQQLVDNIFTGVKIGCEVTLGAAGLWLKTKLTEEGFEFEQTGLRRSASFKDVINWVFKSGK